MEPSEASGDDTRSYGEGAAADPAIASPFALARSLVKNGDPKGALRILDREVAAGREDVDVLRLIARAALQLGDDARAERALERAVALSPDDVVTNVRLVRVLLRSGATSGAAEPRGREVLHKPGQSGFVRLGERRSASGE